MSQKAWDLQSKGERIGGFSDEVMAKRGVESGPGTLVRNQI